MERVTLGRTGIEVSRLGVGTGTAHPSGYCIQKLMDDDELAGLLHYAFDRGINFFDTAVQYGTHRHVRKALQQINRSDVILTTKLPTCNDRDTTVCFDRSLNELGVEYIDVCLLHGVRTAAELRKRAGALDTLLQCKKEGRVRAVGLSSHGLSALKAATELPDIDIVYARINYAGLAMDASRLGLYDRVESIPSLKKITRVLPNAFVALVRPQPESQRIHEDDRTRVEETLKIIHSQGKGIVGMKVLAEGALRHESERAVRYVRDLPHVDALVIGMLNKQEIDENLKAVSELRTVSGG